MRATPALLRSAILSAALALLIAPQEVRGDDAELRRFDAQVKAEDRSHWAFQPVRKPIVPPVKDTHWGSNPIDAFVLAKLEAKGWKPAPSAEPHALLRRLYLDLIGLPPSLAEQEAFLKDPSPRALERVARDLLSRPSHGERWTRHWLDLVRYAETNGYERDATKPHAWRYRDYVIRSLNADKPYDRFVLEQLAGDELADADAETLIATGFYRLGPWDDEPADPKQDRYDQLDDILNTTSQVLLGLTLACARCHNHKFEPLTMADYYRMVAVFNTLERPRQGRNELDLPIGSRAELAAAAERDRRLAPLNLEVRRQRLSAAVQPLIAVPSSPPVAALGVMGERLRLSAVEEQKIQRLRNQTPDLPRGYFLREPTATPPPTAILIRGSAARPGPAVEPGVPVVLTTSQPSFTGANERSSGRRLALARWIASPSNPLTARVIVNRVWQHHFGEGLVRSPSDFGRHAEPPTHPELLDWLADWFVREGWSLKKLHHLIVTSSTYRMSKRWHADHGRDDPEDRLLWRVPYRRLEVEAIRDAMLSVSGQLNPAMYGPSIYPHVPKEAMAGHSDPDKIWKPFDEKEAARRTVYAFIKRSMVVPMLEVLDLCDTARSTGKRPVTTVAPQALTLFNGDFVNRQAGHFADRLVREAGDDPSKQIEHAYRLAVCRLPTDAERAALVGFLERETEGLVKEKVKPEEARRKALEQVCRVIFNLNEFVYAD